MNQVSLFAGIGAFELAAQRFKIKTVFSCEIDKHAASVLNHRFPDTEVFNGDVRTVRGSDIISRYGKIDIITGGFPCQAFSIAGKRQGFEDATRGTLFFEVARLADEIRPDLIILENVKGILNHEGGKTFAIILLRMGELGYDIEWQLLNSKDFGVPQNRERVFIVGHLRGTRTRQIFPIRKNVKNSNKSKENTKRIVNVAQTMTARQYSNWSGNFVEEFSKPIMIQDVLRKNKKQNGKGYKSKEAYSITSQAEQGVMIGDRIRRLTPIECERLQGFPDDWTVVGSDNQRYKQMGNSITVNVLKEIYKKINGGVLENV